VHARDMQVALGMAADASKVLKQMEADTEAKVRTGWCEAT